MLTALTLCRHLSVLIAAVFRLRSRVVGGSVWGLAGVLTRRVSEEPRGRGEPIDCPLAAVDLSALAL